MSEHLCSAEDVARLLAHAIDEWGGCFDCCTDNGAAFDRLHPDDDPNAQNGDLIEAALLDLVKAARAEALAGFVEERRTREDGYAGSASAWDATGRTQTTTTFIRPGTRERRLVGPWEPIEGDA